MVSAGLGPLILNPFFSNLLITGLIILISSFPSFPSSPLWGLSELTEILGSEIPKSNLSDLMYIFKALLIASEISPKSLFATLVDIEIPPLCNYKKSFFCVSVNLFHFAASISARPSVGTCIMARPDP